VITGEHLQLWFWRVAGGAQGSVLHHHPDEEQIGIVVRGRLDMRIGEKQDEGRVVLGPGDVYLAPRNVWHGDSVFIGDDELDEVWILDIFSPVRQDLDPMAAPRE
jgi:quercetin dioxygenase-like cupin family protein